MAKEGMDRQSEKRSKLVHFILVLPLENVKFIQNNCGP